MLVSSSYHHNHDIRALVISFSRVTKYAFTKFERCIWKINMDLIAALNNPFRRNQIECNNIRQIKIIICYITTTIIFNFTNICYM